MNISEFYEKVGGKVDEALERMLSEDRIKKYLNKFAANDAVEVLGKKIEEKDYEAAFAAVHDLKGMSLNLSLDILAGSASELTEALRHGPKGDLDALYTKVCADYEMTIAAIAEFAK